MPLILLRTTLNRTEYVIIHSQMGSNEEMNGKEINMNISTSSPSSFSLYNVGRVFNCHFVSSSMRLHKEALNACRLTYKTSVNFS